MDAFYKIPLSNMCIVGHTDYGTVAGDYYNPWAQQYGSIDQGFTGGKLQVAELSLVAGAVFKEWDLRLHTWSDYTKVGQYDDPSYTGYNGWPANFIDYDIKNGKIFTLGRMVQTVISGSTETNMPCDAIITYPFKFEEDIDKQIISIDISIDEKNSSTATINVPLTSSNRYDPDTFSYGEWKINKKVVIKTGYDDYNITTFTGIITDMDIDITKNNKVLKITAHDYLYILRNCILMERMDLYGISAKDAIEKVIRYAIETKQLPPVMPLEEGGLFHTFYAAHSQVSNIILSHKFDFEPPTNIIGIIDKIKDYTGWNVFFDKNGIFNIKETEFDAPFFYEMSKKHEIINSCGIRTSNDFRNRVVLHAGNLVGFDGRPNPECVFDVVDKRSIMDEDAENYTNGRYQILYIVDQAFLTPDSGYNIDNVEFIGRQILRRYAKSETSIAIETSGSPHLNISDKIIVYDSKAGITGGKVFFISSISHKIAHNEFITTMNITTVPNDPTYAYNFVDTAHGALAFIDSVTKHSNYLSIDIVAGLYKTNVTLFFYNKDGDYVCLESRHWGAGEAVPPFNPGEERTFRWYFKDLDDVQLSDRAPYLIMARAVLVDDISGVEIDNTFSIDTYKYNFDEA